jgi:hypothetical protein
MRFLTFDFRQEGYIRDITQVQLEFTDRRRVPPIFASLLLAQVDMSHQGTLGHQLLSEPPKMMNCKQFQKEGRQ